MVNPEKRNKKPYAMPVQIMPCRGMLIQKVANDLKQALTDNDMNVVGNAALEAPAMGTYSLSCRFRYGRRVQYVTLSGQQSANQRLANTFRNAEKISHWSESKMSGMLSIKRVLLGHGKKLLHAQYFSWKLSPSGCRVQRSSDSNSHPISAVGLRSRTSSSRRPSHNTPLVRSNWILSSYMVRR